MNLQILMIGKDRVEGEWCLRLLREAGHTVHWVTNLAQVQAIMSVLSPDLLLMEWTLPNSAATEMVLALRASRNMHGLPIIALSLDDDAYAKIAALDAGADDCMVIPCHAGELHARIRAVLRRRSPPQDGEVVRLNGLLLDPLVLGVTAQTDSGPRAVPLSPLEFRLLHFFVVHPQQTHSRMQLLDHVWGNRHAYVGVRTVDVCVHKLRLALTGTPCDGKLQTVRGRGYCLVVGAGGM
ncbi:winged helix-turn-helix domain-containing protein [Ralstonia sp. A12]|uniref:winged helix-turn-helix domain-containing protein n=1 Tax=Ralstonia sp. A12 TaxID=1217052 RepID=UPI000A037913|nr:winged helix-turn-helix domain-containing protein [Ralstonia sp. A12]